MRGTCVRGHGEKNPRLVVEDPGSEVMEENRRGGKDEEGIEMGTKENVN